MRPRTYEEFNAQLLLLLRGIWDRVIFLDMETDVRGENFLRDERILLISIGRCISKCLSSDGIKIKSFILESDSDDRELELLVKFNEELRRLRPLAVVGFGIRSYDIPLLAMKKQKYVNRREYLWKIVDLVEQALHIDLCHMLRYYCNIKRFDEVYSHEYFSGLPFKRAKCLVTNMSRYEKGNYIFDLWIRDKEKLQNYCEGEVFDMILVTEKLIELLERRGE